MEDKKISEMAELLCRGVKMLSHHCPDCGVPLFQDGDRIFCPVCGREAVFESELKAESDLNRSAERQGELSTVPQETKGSLPEGSLSDALKSIERTISRLCAEIEGDKDVSSLEKKLKLVNELINVAERIIELKEKFQ